MQHDYMEKWRIEDALSNTHLQYFSVFLSSDFLESPIETWENIYKIQL